MSIRIVLVDDHKMMREGLKSLLHKEDGIEVIAQAENGRAALQFCEKFLPDVVVMDVSMPDLNGIDATRQIMSRCPGTKVIALSMHSDRQFVVEMLRAGASGYLLKDSAFEDLASVIRSVAASPAQSGARHSALVLDEQLTQGPTEPLIAPRLTEREREVLQLIAEGRATKEIASDLHLSAKTVETHRQHLMEKLDMYSVAELTKYAIRKGLTTLDH